jgi:hypothetical protein
MPDPNGAADNSKQVQDAFLIAFGEPISRTLDLSTWRQAGRLGDLFGQLQIEISGGQELEAIARIAVRDKAFPRLSEQPSAPLNAGVYRVKKTEIEAIQRGLLFTGAVEACNGIAVTHESLSLSITQVGVCLVSYHADRGSWVHRLYRRDLRESIDDPVQIAQDLINRRHRHESEDQATGLETSRLTRRSILTYAERATLVQMSEARWRMGRGNPVPYELLTGSGSADLIVASIDMLKRLILEHQTFVFVSPSLAQRGLMTIADALKPLEYAIINSMTDSLNSIVDSGHYSNEIARQLRAFVKEVGPKLIVGCYRASEIGPARIFYAHVDHSHEAAQIAMADSRLQAHRGFPMLLDLAGEICQTSFGPTDFVATVQDAYISAGQPYAFHQEFGPGR